MTHTASAIITTTINVPTLLRDYLADAQEHGHVVKIIVAGDRKTPAEVPAYCAELQRAFGSEVLYMGVDAQEEYLHQFPRLATFLPWNSVQRRNVAILKAYEEGFSTIITIDDDNYLSEKNFLGGHQQVGSICDIDCINADHGWFNNCHFLRDVHGREFFARGYPVRERRRTSREFRRERGRGKIVVNGGLWLGDPDIDAVTRLAAPIDATEYVCEGNFALAVGTWCPFNSQNTALARDVIPAYFLSPHVGRFDDIWASYIVKHCADHFGDFISFGHPLVRQNRNAHNLWHDLDLERLGMQWTEAFCASIAATKLTGTTYAECTEEILSELERWVGAEQGLGETYRSRLLLFVHGYRLWLSIVGK